MKKTGFFLLQVIGMLAINPSYAEDATNGYAMSVYGSVVKEAYGECVHTAYYDPNTDHRIECGDQIGVASAPVVEAPEIVENQAR